MNKAELNQSLEFLNNPTGELQIIIYACFEEQATKKLDIKAEDLPPIRRLFVDSVNNAIISQEEFTVIPLSTADERGNCFYEYDLELPEELQVLGAVIGNDEIEIFSLNNDTFAEIDALVIVLADDNNEISLYKKLSPVEVLGRGGYMLWKSNQRLERFEEQLLRISPSFQVLQVEESTIILNLKTIEKSFGFHDVIKREATIGLEAINDMEIVSNIDTLEELIENVSFARKLTKIARNSPVIQKSIPNVNIIAFSRTHPAIRNKMRYTPDGTQFALDTKVSKDLFVKLLNDDFLTSELTQLYYDSLAKDNIENEKEQIEDEANG
jgi:hypothetical protein